jgi:hypothetical protein
MTEVYTLYSESGDEYKLQFTTDRSGIIADDLLDQLNNQDIEVVEIGLARVKGQNVTGHKVLWQIEECIANLMQRMPNVILSYFCDFIHLVPSQKKNMTVQEYRSRMFSAMFKRYLSQHRELDICDDEIKINGVAEPFFFHVIYHKHHQHYAEIISEGHIKSFGKPDEG